jgi:hypothetical protein
MRRDQNYASHMGWVQARARQHNEFIATRHSEIRAEQNARQTQAQHLRATETKVMTASERVKEQRAAHSEWISCNTRVRQRIRDLNAKANDEKIRQRNEKLERKHDANRIDNCLLNAREQFGRKRLEMALIRETTRQQAVRLANVRQAEHLRVSLAQGRDAEGSLVSRYVGSSSPRERSILDEPEALTGYPPESDIVTGYPPESDMPEEAIAVGDEDDYDD